MFLLYVRIRALIYRRIRRHKNPPPKAAMEACEFIHVRLHIGSYSMTQIETLDKAVAIFQYEAE